MRHLAVVDSNLELVLSYWHAPHFAREIANTCIGQRLLPGNPRKHAVEVSFCMRSQKSMQTNSTTACHATKTCSSRCILQRGFRKLAEARDFRKESSKNLQKRRSTAGPLRDSPDAAGKSCSTPVSLQQNPAELAEPASFCNAAAKPLQKTAASASKSQIHSWIVQDHAELTKFGMTSLNSGLAPPD